MSEKNTKRAMLTFGAIWLGQLVSVLATTMTGFALTLWVFEQTGQATALALVHVFFITPFLVVSPFAGVMIDRYNRKLMMMISDLGGGLASMVILTLVLLGRLEIWHLYIAAVIQGLTNTFHWPAYSAAISTMVPKEQYGRVNGMMGLVEMGPAVIGPILAGALIGLIGLEGILVIDIVTFLFAISVLALVHIPQPKQTDEGRKAQGNLLKEAAYGFKYILDRPSLLGLQLVFLCANFFSGIGQTLHAPLILARTGNNELLYGSVQMLGALGGITGGVLMGVWGGFKKRSLGVLLGWMLSGLVALTLYGFGQSLVVWGTASFLGMVIAQLVNASNQSIWMAKVAPDLQGRVFSARRLIAWVTTPITPLIGAPLADFVLEPAMRGDGVLPTLFGPLVGTGPGSGMALVMITAGLLASSVGVIAFFIPAVREAESALPDHQQDAGRGEAGTGETG